MRSLAAVALGLVVGCGVQRGGSVSGGGGAGGVDAGPPPVPGLTALEISPPQTTLYVSSSMTSEQDFTALGHFADGSSRDVTAMVGWTLDDPLGDFRSLAHLVASNARGGATQVRARAGSVEATAALIVIVRDQHVAPGTRPDAGAHFAGAENPSLAPMVVYPADWVLVPPNLGTMELQWQRPTGTDLYDLHFVSDFVDLHIYTQQTGTYTPSPEEWRWLADSHRGSFVDYTVRATVSTSAVGAVGTSASRRINFAQADVKGGLYYWSATQPDTEGIWRFDFGATLSSPERYLAQSDPNVGRCVACHSITRDGTRIAFTWDGGSGAASVADVATRRLLITYAQNIHSCFTSFNPDGTRVITTNNGVLTQREADGGTSLGDVPTGGTASMPDWSADGNHLVFVTHQGTDYRATSGSIQVIDYNNGVWGTPRMLVASQGGDNNYYPQFSPDGEWIVYNHAASDNSYNNPGAEVWIVRSDGAGSPFKLEAAHAGAMMTDSWPRWSPFMEMHEQGAIMWITVSSKRAYGVELAAGSRPQLWMFAFDTRRAAGGTDGSYPAFWLPFQNRATNNHIAQWTTRIVPIGQSLGQGDLPPPGPRK
jgi:hypothetical protein